MFKCTKIVLTRYMLLLLERRNFTIALTKRGRTVFGFYKLHDKEQTIFVKERTIWSPPRCLKIGIYHRDCRIYLVRGPRRAGGGRPGKILPMGGRLPLFPPRTYICSPIVDTTLRYSSGS